MPVQQLKDYLDQAGVEYMCLSHPPAFTAQELAHHVKIAGDRVVKTVILSQLIHSVTRKLRNLN